jgi:hypothetical protein
VIDWEHSGAARGGNLDSIGLNSKTIEQEAALQMRCISGRLSTGGPRESAGQNRFINPSQHLTVIQLARFIIWSYAEKDAGILPASPFFLKCLLNHELRR